jgi:hypothetical protein
MTNYTVFNTKYYLTGFTMPHFACTCCAFADECSADFFIRPDFLSPFSALKSPTKHYIYLLGTKV